MGMAMAMQAAQVPMHMLALLMVHTTRAGLLKALPVAGCPLQGSRWVDDNGL